MFRNIHPVLFFTFVCALPLLIAGCSKNEEAPGEPLASGGPGGDMGGPSGRGDKPGSGRFAPVSASATASEIFQQKCSGCHGDQGQGVRGPNITKEGSRPDAELFKIVHDGKGRMPGFGNQMTEAQVKEVVTYVKQFDSKK